MEPKRNDKNGRLPSFGNNFLTLFGLMVLDDNERRFRTEIADDEDLEDETMHMNEDDFDETDVDTDEEYDGDEDDL
jgi:hypothetical protein